MGAAFSNLHDPGPGEVGVIIVGVILVVLVIAVCIDMCLDVFNKDSTDD